MNNCSYNHFYSQNGHSYNSKSTQSFLNSSFHGKVEDTILMDVNNHMFEACEDLVNFLLDRKLLHLSNGDLNLLAEETKRYCDNRTSHQSKIAKVLEDYRHGLQWKYVQQLTQEKERIREHLERQIEERMKNYILVKQNNQLSHRVEKERKQKKRAELTNIYQRYKKEDLVDLCKISNLPHREPDYYGSGTKVKLKEDLVRMLVAHDLKKEFS